MMIIAKMTGTVWMAVHYLATYCFIPRQQYGNLDKYPGEISLRIGDVLNTCGLHVSCNGSEGMLSQNWTVASVCFRNYHQSSTEDFPYGCAEEAIAEAVHENVLLDPALRKHLLGDADAMDCFAKTFRPACWNGKSLRIPVNYVKICQFQRHGESGAITCTIKLGDHLQLMRQEILGTCFAQQPTGYHLNRSDLLDPRLAGLVDEMLTNKDVICFMHQDVFPFDADQEGFVACAEGAEIESSNPSIPMRLC